MSFTNENLSAITALPPGAYEALLDEELDQLLQRQPELRSLFGKLDPEEEPSRYASFVARVLEKALQVEVEPKERWRLCNELIERIAGKPTTEFLLSRRLVSTEKPLLLEITPPHYAEPGMRRPETTLGTSSLFTGSPSDPQLMHELSAETPCASHARPPWREGSPRRPGSF